MIDASPTGRVHDHLVGYWTFDDADMSTTIADTAPIGPATPLASSLAVPTFSNGVITLSADSRLMSAAHAHQCTDAVDNGAVTLEAWVLAADPSRGTPGQPAVIAGLDSNQVSRDITLFQSQDHWLGRVRTTADGNGAPDLLSTSTVSTTDMTHLVLVADGTKRTLYVNNVAEDPQTATGLVGWDCSYKMIIGNEPQTARPWHGQLALVAIYNIALDDQQIARNFAAGPSAN